MSLLPNYNTVNRKACTKKFTSKKLKRISDFLVQAKSEAYLLLIILAKQDKGEQKQYFFLGLVTLLQPYGLHLNVPREVLLVVSVCWFCLS